MLAAIHCRVDFDQYPAVKATRFEACVYLQLSWEQPYNPSANSTATRFPSGRFAYRSQDPAGATHTR